MYHIKTNTMYNCTRMLTMPTYKAIQGLAQQRYNENTIAMYHTMYNFIVLQYKAWRNRDTTMGKCATDEETRSKLEYSSFGFLVTPTRIQIQKTNTKKQMQMQNSPQLAPFHANEHEVTQCVHCICMCKHMFWVGQVALIYVWCSFGWVGCTFQQTYILKWVCCPHLCLVQPGMGTLSAPGQTLASSQCEA